MIYVVGSGPAGIAGTYALLKKGEKVTMLDCGFELENEIKERLKRIENAPFKNWDLKIINSFKEKTLSLVSPNGIPVKYAYGSDFAYYTQDIISNSKNVVEILSSYAKGGLSNVWGGVIMPYLEEDITDWPISFSSLSPHYKEVLSLIRLNVSKDDPDEIFHLETSNCHFLKPSQQIIKLMKNLSEHKQTLKKEGFIWGFSRIAMQNTKECVYCGLCMYGCPYSLIYNTASTLHKFFSYRNFYYKKDIFVKKIIERDGKVNIIANSQNKELNLEGERVYLACGSLQTTKILLRSMEEYNKKITLKTSQHFLLPLFMYENTKDVVFENLHTLSQAFIEICDSSISKNKIYFQVYAYNDFYLAILKKILGRLFMLFKIPIYNFILGRLVLLQGYLHSDLSPTILLKLDSRLDKINVEVNPNPLTKKTITRAVRKMFKNRKYLKAIQIPFMTKISPPGGGAHIGGTFPMKKEPSDFESDILGRPYGFQRTYIIDSTIFPSIPASPITLSIMANAHRIASK